MALMSLSFQFVTSLVLVSVLVGSSNGRSVPSRPDRQHGQSELPASVSRFQVEILVPRGSNPIASPPSPDSYYYNNVKRVVPSGPNRQESPDSPSDHFQVERLGPGGPDPITSSPSPDS